ncbi:MAG: flagellar filament capping protein FliD [Spirochaetia bacterium]|nr:flagellar filament capping protein FliD [Spirochaetia bacterium]
MPAPIIDGLSGFQAAPVIEKLKKLEEQPIHRMRNEQAGLGVQIQALEGLKEQTRKLQKSLNILYSFEAAFEQKKIATTPEGIIEGVANKNAEIGSHNIKVKNLAASLKVKSDSIKSKDNLSAAKITINDITKKFNGGSVEALKDFFNANFDKILKAKTVNINGEESVLVLEGIQTGKKGVWQITDHDKLLDKLGIYRPRKAHEPQKAAPPPEAMPQTREEGVPLTFKPEFLFVTAEGPSEISPDRRTLTLSDNAGRKYGERPKALPNGSLKKLKLRLKYHSGPEKEEDMAPFSITEGPVDTLNIQGIILNSYNITRKREIPQIEDKVYDYGIRLNYSTGSSQSLSLKGRGELVEIPVSKDIVSYEFYTQNAQTDFSNVEWIYEVKAEPKPAKDDAKKEDVKPELKDGNQNFPNIIDPAQDSVVNLDGVDIERDKNDGIKDILPNTTLRLLKPSDETVKTEIMPNTEKAITQILDFIKDYNDLIAYTRKETKAPKIKESDGLDEKDNEVGTLITNSSVRSLVNSLRIKALNAYPAQKDPKIKILPMLGISTGKIGSNWKSISEGFLEVDEEKLKEMLLNHPEAVKDFFGIDTNGDLRIDNGMAYTLNLFLTPYTQYPKGIIDSQIASNKERITRLNKDIKKVEEHVEKYVQKLREQYGRAGYLMQQQKAIGESIKNKLGK